MTIYISKYLARSQIEIFQFQEHQQRSCCYLEMISGHPMPGLHVSTESGYFQGVQGRPFERLHFQNCPILRNHVLFQNEYFYASQDI